MEEVLHHIVIKGIEEGVKGAAGGEDTSVILIIIVVALLGWIIWKFLSKKIQ